MSYTPEDVFNQFRSDVDDIEEPHLWTDEDLIRYFNRAREDLYRRLPLIDNTTDEDSDSVPITEITLVSGTRDYTYSPLIKTIDKVVLASTGYELHKWSPDSLEDYARNWRAMTGPIKIYVEGLGGPRSISFLPTPAEADTVYMTVTRGVELITFASYQTALTTPPEEWMDALVTGMKARAYKKHNSEVYNPQLATQYEAEFTAMVGPPVSVREDQARRLNANTSLHYRPEKSFYRSPRLSGRSYNRRYRPDWDW